MERRYKAKLVLVPDGDAMFQVPAYFYENGVSFSVEANDGDLFILRSPTTEAEHDAALATEGVTFVEDVALAEDAS